MDETIKKLEITEDNKTDFFKCFLADKPYEETIKLFDGKATVTFRALTSGETTAVFNQLRKDQANSSLTNDPAYMMAMTTYRLGLALIDFNGEDINSHIDPDLYKPKGDDDSYVKARSLVFKGWSVFKLSGVVEAFKQFENKLVELTDNIQTENFWKAGK